MRDAPSPDEIRDGTVATVGVSSAVVRTDREVERELFDLLHAQLGDACAPHVDDAMIPTEPITETIAERADAAATDVLGHVLFADYDDDAGELDVRREARSSFDGIVAILESSPGSYHVWSLSVRDLDRQVLRALRTGSDPRHVQQSYRRGRFIVRCAPKYRVADDGRATERYKDAPSVVDALIVEPESGGLPPQSRPHYQLLRELADDDLGLDDDRLDRVDWRGEQLIRSDYLTMDDDTKRRGLA